MFITRFSLLAVLAYLLSLLMVACRPVSSESVSLSELLCPSQLPQALPDENTSVLRPEVPPTKRHYRLYNRCGGIVQSRGKTFVTAKKDDHGLGELVVEAVTYNKTECRIGIRGRKSKAFLCFNKKGKLMGRYKFIPEDCTFEERIDAHSYSELVQSRSNGTTWYVGFKKNGKALKGSAYTSKKFHHCIQFMKLDPTKDNGQRDNKLLLEEAVRSLEGMPSVVEESSTFHYRRHPPHSGHRRGRHTHAAALKPRR